MGVVMPFCQLSCHFSTILTVSVCAEQNLISFVLFPCFILFKFCTLVHVNPFFYIFPSTLSLGIFSRHSVAAVCRFPKRFTVQNNTEVVKSDGETMRSLCGILVCMWWS